MYLSNVCILAASVRHLDLLMKFSFDCLLLCE